MADLSVADRSNVAGQPDCAPAGGGARPATWPPMRTWPGRCLAEVAGRGEEGRWQTWSLDA